VKWREKAKRLWKQHAPLQPRRQVVEEKYAETLQ
jgi:hypothetical protein